MLIFAIMAGVKDVPGLHGWLVAYLKPRRKRIKYFKIFHTVHSKACFGERFEITFGNMLPHTTILHCQRASGRGGKCV